MGDIVWHGHHESDCPLEELTGTIEQRRQRIIATKPPAEYELRLRLLKPASPEAVEAWRAYRAAVATALAAYDAAMVPAQAAFGAAVAPAHAAYDAAMVPAQAAYDAVKVTALQPILALHAIECPDCPWDGHTIFGGTA